MPLQLIGSGQLLVRQGGPVVGVHAQVLGLLSQQQDFCYGSLCGLTQG